MNVSTCPASTEPECHVNRSLSNFKGQNWIVAAMLGFAVLSCLCVMTGYSGAGSFFLLLTIIAPAFLGTYAPTNGRTAIDQSNENADRASDEPKTS